MELSKRQLEKKIANGMFFLRNPKKIFSEIYRKYPYKFKLPSFPPMLDIEATNACNLDCLMCSRQIMTRKVGFMDFDLYKRIIDEAAREGAIRIRLIRWGEPLLHPQIIDMIKYAKSKNLLVHITSNGILLNRSMAEKLLNAGLNGISISMQGLNKEEYEKIRNKGKYEILVENIKQLEAVRKEHNRKSFYIHVGTSILDETDSEVKEFIREWYSVVDTVSCSFTSLRGLQDVERVKELIPRQRVPPPSRKLCTEVRRKLSIDWNGDVTACCGDFNCELKLGNVKESSLKELWHSKKLEGMRKILARGEKDKIPFCRLCDGE